MGDKDFIEEVFCLAFGDDAINKGYTHKEVLNKIKEFSDNALNYKEAYNILMEYWDSLPEEEKDEIDKRLKEWGL